jgi:opacity protein-like surface antigen
MKYLLATAALAAGLASPAAAQVLGTYTGTSADGNGVSVTVGTDPNNNDLAITGASVGFSAPCKGSTGFVLDTGWGFNPNADIVNGKVTVNYDFSYLSSTITLTFNNNTNTASGFITDISPTLYVVGPKPKKALFCESAKQAVTLTFSGTARLPALPPGAAMMYPVHR